ncbi:MAG: hypothetical protein EXR02_00055 [Rhodospirillales bacterium]|nr:hypothetical protein [Rhodospirillales bacterium]MSP79450.1 hypothetical protein [Rhodospirillales bacterium]
MLLREAGEPGNPAVAGGGTFNERGLSPAAPREGRSCIARGVKPARPGRRRCSGSCPRLCSPSCSTSAREALEAADVAQQLNPAKSAAPATPAPAKSPPTRNHELTDARRELIRNALATQRSKQHLFDNLSEDAKAKLLITAVKAMGIPPDEIERSLRARGKNSGPGSKS